MKTIFRRLFVILTLVVSISLMLGHSTSSADEPGVLQIEMRLFQAVFQADEPGPTSSALLLNLTKVGDRWERVVGTAGNFSRGIDFGYVTDAKLSKDEFEVSVKVNLVGGGYARIDERGTYRGRLTHKEGNLYEGTYTGTFKGAKLKGFADAVVIPAAVAKKPGFQPIRPGEHPRILFRKSDLPALREKAKTPLGKAALAKMTGGIALGVKYQLTGDKKYADQSRAAVERFLDGDFHIQAPGSHHGMLHWGPLWEQAAVAYDLCHDVWPDDFKRRVERSLCSWSRRIFFQHLMFNTQAQYDFGNSEAMWFHYGPALAGLAMWGEKGPRPIKPIEPDPATEIPPASDYKPGKNVPVVPLRPGKSPDKWLFHQPILDYLEADPLESLGGAESCRPESGTPFTHENRKYVFEPLPADRVPPGGGVILNVGKSIILKYRAHVGTKPGPEIAKDAPITMCLFTVLKNDRPRQVKVSAPFSPNGWQQFVLNGHNLAHGQVVRLDKGLYPLVIVLRIRARWTYLTTRLDEATAEDVEQSKALLARLQQKYENRLTDWKWDVAEWERTDGANQNYRKLFELTRWVMYTHHREGFGTGAAQSDTAGMCRTMALFPATYAAAYRRCFGMDVSPHADITHFVPRRIYSHIYPRNGEPVTVSVNGPNELNNPYFALHFPIVPETMKPAVLWAWHRHAGIDTSADVPDKVLNGPIESALVRAFIDYPLDMKTRPPKGIMPLAWEAPDFGYFGFRNAWNGKDDFLVQVYGRCQSGHGYNIPNAGNFVIQGLGHTWARAMPSLRLHNQRTFANVVLLTDDDTNDGGRGRVTYAKTERNGSGVVTFDLSDVYASAHKDKKGRPMKLYEKYARARRDAAFKPSGIEGLRSFGVDYSGKSGAPCLFVIIDKINGGNDKVWCWRLKDDQINAKTKEVTAPGDLASTKVEGNTVTVTKPDGATMQMTFVAPGRTKIRAEKRSITYTKAYNRGKGQMPAPGVYASGASAKDGQFFVIATMQRGKPPAVKVRGSGLSAVATVGNQTVRFDGEKVVFGK